MEQASTGSPSYPYPAITSDDGEDTALALEMTMKDDARQVPGRMLERMLEHRSTSASQGGTCRGETWESPLPLC